MYAISKPLRLANLIVLLQPGTYRITCPVGPHAFFGMRLTLTVTPAVARERQQDAREGTTTHAGSWLLGIDVQDVRS